MSESIDDLVRKARDGDEAAFKAIMDAWGPRVLAFMRAKLGSEEDALDASQEVFVRLWSALDRFRLGESFPAWLFAIAANHARSRWRSRAFEQRKHRAVAVEAAAAPLSDPAEVAHEELRAAELRRGVAGLSDDLRQVVELYYFAGLDVKETAKALGLGEEAVKSRLFRARGKLRQALEKSQPAGPAGGIHQ